MDLNPLHLRGLGFVCPFPPAPHNWMVVVKYTYSGLHCLEYCLFSKWMFYPNISWTADPKVVYIGLTVQF